MSLLRLIPMVAVSDLDRAMFFYRDVLGFEITDSAEHDGKMIWCAARAGGTEVMFQTHPKQAEKNGGTVFWLYTNDIDALHGQLKARGYNVSDPETEDGRRECEMQDADSNVLMFCQLMSA